MTPHSDRLWGPVPEGFQKQTNGNGLLVIIRSDVKKFIRPDICLTESETQPTKYFEGREKLRAVTLTNGETALIRAYCHGGLFRQVTGRTFFTWPPRPFRELTITEELRRRGIATVEVYGACVASVWGPFYHGWLIMKELSDAHDLWTAFQSGLVEQIGAEHVWAVVARTIKALHQQGVYHRDLNLKNILLRNEAQSCKGYIIDFDRAKLVLGQLPLGLARRNLQRLLRSVRKFDPARNLVSEADWQHFLNCYYAEPDGRGTLETRP